MTPQVRSYEELVRQLTKSASDRKQAAQNDPVPDTDPQETGTVAIPTDADAQPAKQNTPESKANDAAVTPEFTAPAPAKKVDGEEKVSNLVDKASKIAASIKALAVKKAGDGKSVTPNMPPNDKENTGSDEGTNQPPSGGAGAKNNPDPAVKDAAPEEKADPTAEAAPKPTKDDKGELPPDEKNAGGCMEDKRASVEEDEKFDPDFHFKLASVILSTEEGREFAQREIEKAHGAEAAANLVKAAMLMEQRSEELTDAEAEGAAQMEEMWKNASEDEKRKIVKIAQVHNLARNKYKTDLEKQAYDEGAMMAGQLDDAGMVGAEPPAEGEIPDEAIIMALEEMVQSGQITPEVAAEVLNLLQGGGEGGGAMGGEIGPEMGGEIPEEMKEAAAVVQVGEEAMTKLAKLLGESTSDKVEEQPTKTASVEDKA